MRRHFKTISIMLTAVFYLASASASEEAVIAGSKAIGDITFLTAFSTPAGERGHFEDAAKLSVQQSLARNANVWLLYDDLSSDSETARYFSIHFPHDVNELTEPNAANYDLISNLGHYRHHAELTRQVADWCSTTSVDPYKLAYAYVDYLWLKPGKLEAAGELLARRGALLREIYGAGSDGNAAAEGFVSMVAPGQLMLVLFSSMKQKKIALEVLETDIENAGRHQEWRRIDGQLEELIDKKSYRNGKFRADLSADG